MNQNEYQKVRRRNLKEQGLCVECGNVPPRDNRATCENCGRRQVESQSKWYKKAKKKRQGMGLCTCGKQVIVGKKTCEDCNKRTIARYYKRRRLGLCASCGNKSRPGMTGCEECAKKLSEEKKQTRAEVLNAYGGAICACCGETIEKFLVVDHINNDGAEHRRTIRRNTINKWLKDNNFPPGYQVLCFNCNMGKQLNGGICPHKQVNPTA